MKNNSIVRLLIVMLVMTSVMMSAQAQEVIVKWREGQAATGSEQRIGFRYPLPVQEQSFEAFQATTTVEIGTTVAVKCPTLAANTRVLIVGTIGSVLNWGNDDVPTGAAYPFSIASGSFRLYNVSTSTPDLYFRSQTASATVYFYEY
jgi:hypothetical protein